MITLPFLDRKAKTRRLARIMASFPPGHDLYGLTLMRSARVSSGLLYPLLKHWEQLGVVESGWTEDGRRWYQVTEIGRLHLAAVRDGEVSR